jgi:hypothetical protein
MSTLGFPTDPEPGDTHQSGDKIYTWDGESWRITAYATSQATTATFGTVTITSTASSIDIDTGALVVAGGVGVGGDVYVEGRITSESVKIADAVLDSTLVVTDASTATVVIDSYSLNSFRSAKYLVQIDEGTGIDDRCQVAEILLIVSNAKVVAATEYANVYPETDMSLGEFLAGYDDTDNTVKLYFTPYDATVKEIVVLRTGLAV